MFYRVISFFVFILVFSSTTIAQQLPEKLTIFPAPSWVDYQTPDIGTVPEDQIQNGVYYLLVDRQISHQKKSPTQIYRHISLQVVNQNGLQDSSNINVSYDPSYESVQWHQLKVIRDGKPLDREQGATLNILKRERQLEEAVYDGRLTLNIIIPDLRVGDTVDYSYSVIGQNPIYTGHFFDTEYLDWGVPLKRLRIQLDWHLSSDPVIHKLNTSEILKVTPLTDGKRYLLDIKDIPPKKSNSQIPSWYDPYGRIYFSDISDWSQVIDWGVPLYESAIKSSPEIDKVVAHLKQTTSNPSQQASLALHYVQENIRYLGVEMGKNSHQPSPAADTLQRRYGDCKDKAVLLITLLRKLGFEAWPALVNTDMRKEIINFPPAINAFNHVIVMVQANGRAYWLDPTRPSQKGDIDVLYQADYGYALVVLKQMKGLQRMPVRRNSTQRIEEYIDVSGKQDAPVSYQVNSQYTGYESEVLRNSFRGSNIHEKSDDYLNFYKKYYENIELQEQIFHEDNDQTGMLKLVEKYQIKNFWTTTDSKSEATFYANAISTVISKPDELVRVAPFDLKETEVKEILHIKLDDSNWDLDTNRFEEKNPYFEFSKVVLFDKQKAELTLEFFYKTIADSVPANDISTYLDARKKVVDELEYSVSITKAENTTASYWPLIAWFTFIIAYCAALIATIVLWMRDKSKFDYLDESKFYPVSLPKFIVLSFVTLGLYQLYWYYRNWCYIKRADNVDILPFARAFFSGFWAYSFYKRLVNGEETKDIKFLPKATWAAILFAIIYFATSILSGKEAGVLFTTAFILVSTPLVWYVLQIPQSSDAPLKNNSRWLWRHTFLALVGTPIFALVYGQGLAFLPGGEIMEGKSLHGYDLRFMQRHKIVPSDEPIIYFYSTAILNMQDSGNGFTEKTVFAYWHSDDGSLVIKSVPFTKIKNITENKQGEHSLKIKDATGDDFDIYLSSTASGNRRFINRIYQQWQSAQNSQRSQVSR